MNNLFLPSSMTGYARNQSESQYPEYWDGLVGYWDFSVQGVIPPLGQADDLSGNAKHGRLLGDTHSVRGKFGNALRFNGAVDAVDLGSIDIGNSFTISMWEYSNGDCAYNGKDGYFIADSDDPLNLFFRRKSAGVCQLQLGIGDVNSTVIGTYPTEVWNYYTVVHYSNGSFDFYYNGSFVDTVGIGSNFVGFNNNVYLANRQDLARGFNGILDGVMIHKRPLSATEVPFLYAHPKALVTPRHRTIVTVPGPAIVNAAAQADSASSSAAGFRRGRVTAAQADSVSSSLAGFIRGRVAAAQADSVSSSTAGMSISVDAAAQADSVSISTAGFTRARVAGAQADSVSASAAGFRRARSGSAYAVSVSSATAGVWRDLAAAGQANSVSQTFAGFSGGRVSSVEELFRHRRFRLSSTYARRSLKGVF